MQANRAFRTVLPSRALDDLNWMRGLAAVAVLAGHVRGLFFLDYEDVKHSALIKASYLASGFGHQAVIVFFVLSGFFIGSSVAITTFDRSWSWSRFASRRLSRLYVVILPALLLTFLWDTAGMAVWGTDGIYAGKIDAPSLTLPDVSNTLAVSVLAGNLAFLQELVVAPYGSNGPLWSLSYEAWAYVTFPLLFRAAFGDAHLRTRLSMAAVGVLVLALAGSLFRFYFCVWCLGALVATAWVKYPLKRVGLGAVAVAISAFVVALLIGRLRLLGSRWGEDLLLGVSVAVVIATRLARQASSGDLDRTPSGARLRYSRWGEALAGFSFTLYATHYPVLTFFQPWLVGRQRWLPTLAHAAVATLFGLVVIALYAYPLSRITEARTDVVRRWAERVTKRVSLAQGRAT
jgi:peptidoglycan/LPS O-acetylase OafA/YrhL